MYIYIFYYVTGLLAFGGMKMCQNTVGVPPPRRCLHTLGLRTVSSMLRMRLAASVAAYSALRFISTGSQTYLAKVGPGFVR